jgi:hypothetical protein
MDDDEYDYDDDYDDDDSCEPFESCDECDVDIYESDAYFIHGVWLCSYCAWIAMGCPGPK